MDRMWAHFTALDDDPDRCSARSARTRPSTSAASSSITRIQVAYNSFTNTKVDGEQVELGIPH
jgi:hypothetical protein